MHLDPRTLGAIACMVGGALALGFTLLGIILRGQRVLLVWATGFWMGTAGAFFVCLHGKMPDGLAVFAVNGCFALSDAFVLRGLAMHVQRPWRWRGPLLLIAALLALQAWFEFVQPSLMARATIFGLQKVAWDVWIIRVLLGHEQRDIRSSCRFAAAVFALDALFYAARPLILPAVWNEHGLWQAGSPLVVNFLYGIFAALGWNLVFILLIAQRLAVDLGRQARTDALTGLLNRMAVIEEGVRVLELCHRNRLPCSLLMFDLDHFKNINDTWGHDAGDEVLRHFARLLRQQGWRTSDVFGRYGGEEFVLLLPGTRDVDAVALAEQFRLRLSATPAMFGQQPILVTTSIGAATTGEGSMGFEQLVTAADKALYSAKAAGSNCVMPALAHAVIGTAHA